MPTDEHDRSAADAGLADAIARGPLPPQPGRQWSTYGHGHVWHRTDGVLARCGGPGLCDQCSRDLAHARNAADRGDARLREDGTYERIPAATSPTADLGVVITALLAELRYLPDHHVIAAGPTVRLRASHVRRIADLLADRGRLIDEIAQLRLLTEPAPAPDDADPADDGLREPDRQPVHERVAAGGEPDDRRPGRSLELGLAEGLTIWGRYGGAQMRTESVELEAWAVAGDPLPPGTRRDVPVLVLGFRDDAPRNHREHLQPYRLDVIEARELRDLLNVATARGLL